MDLPKIRFGSADWILLAQEKDQLQALVNMIKNFHVK
jgi:hypothetical protein